MASTIIADSPGGQKKRIEEWLAARGGKWTRGLAMAALEGWRERSKEAVAGQERQLGWVPVPHVRPIGEAAEGDVWSVLERVYDGKAATLPEPSRELADAVLNRFLRRVGERLPAPPLPPRPTGPGIGTVLVILGLGYLISEALDGE